MAAKKERAAAAKKKAVVRPESDEMIVSTSVIAACVGKTNQWIGQLTRDGVLAKVSNGKYELRSTIRAYINYVTGVAEEGKVSYNDEKAQHEQIKKEIAQLELEEKRRNLHTTRDVQEAWGDLLVNFRGMLSVLPPNLSGQLAYMTDAKEIRSLLESRINAALIELSNYDPMVDTNGGGDK